MRIVAWFYAGSTILLLLFAVTTAILLNSTRFHNYITRTAEHRRGRASVSSPCSNPPLLQVQHAEASMRIISILLKKWYLNDIRVDHPVVQV